MEVYMEDIFDELYLQVKDIKSIVQSWVDGNINTEYVYYIKDDDDIELTIAHFNDVITCTIKSILNTRDTKYIEERLGGKLNVISHNNNNNIIAFINPSKSMK